MWEAHLGPFPRPPVWSPFGRITFPVSRVCSLTHRAQLQHPCRLAPSCSSVSVPLSAQSPFAAPELESSLGLPGKDSTLSPAEKTHHHLLTQAAVLEEVLVLPERLGRSLKATTEPRMPSSRPHFKHNGRRSGVLWSGMSPFSSLLMYFQQPLFWRYPPPTLSAERD